MHLHLLPILTLSFLALTMASTDDQVVFSQEPQQGDHSKPSLADLLTVETSVSIFYSYARELELSNLFFDPAAGVSVLNVTSRIGNDGGISVLAPTNKAVMALARKPHQSPGNADEGIKITEEEYDRISGENVERWVSAHLVPEVPLDLGSSEPHPTFLEGKSVSFKPIAKHDGREPAWNRVTLEGGVKILEMREASNGVLYVIDGTVIPA